MEQPTQDFVSEAAASRLRAYRKHRRLSLAAVARHVGVSASTLSRLESGQRRLTLELLISLARTYGTTLDELVAHEPMGDPLVNLRAVTHGPMTVLPLSRSAGSVQAFKVVLRPGVPRADSAQHRHEGWQWLLVLTGQLRLTLDRDVFDLKAGEAAEFDTNQPHDFAPADDRPVEYLVLFGPQGERVSLRVSPGGRTGPGQQPFPSA